MTENGLTKHFFFSFLTGLVTFGLHRITGQGGLLFEIDSVLVFAVSVLAPLEFYLIDLPDRNGQRSLFYRMAILWQPAGSSLVFLSLLSETGIAALFLCIPWFLITGCLFLHGLARFLTRGLQPFSELAIHAGMLFLPVGSFWFLAYRLDYPLLGFDTTFVSLTAVHFHYAGFAALLIAGLTGRKTEEIYTVSYRTAVLLLITGIPLTAAGIYISPVIEWAASGMIAAGLFLLSYVNLRYIKRMFRTMNEADNRTRGGFVLLSVSSLSVFYSMFFAVRYATGEFFNNQTLTIPEMVTIHGWINAFVFCFCGLLAVFLLQIKTEVRKPGIPFSKLTWNGLPGPDFFENHGLTDPDIKVTGLTDSMAEYNQTGFNADSLDSGIRNFYEQTDSYDLTVQAEWQAGFRLLSVIYSRFFSSKLQQMNFPGNSESSDIILSKIRKLKDAFDGRKNVRAWVRWYQKTGKTIYAAAYSTHTWQGRTYMNIHFPLPGGGLTSILRLQLVNPGQLLLTSLPDPEYRGDQGVYYVNRLLPVRLPLNETITVYSAAEKNGPLTAKHDMWVFGIHFLKLNYRMKLK